MPAHWSRRDCLNRCCGGTPVPSLTDGDIADAYARRLLLEVTAARAAARHISAEEAADLLGVLRRTETLTHPSGVSRRRHPGGRIQRVVAQGGRLADQ